jgi:hypothetical protein
VFTVNGESVSWKVCAYVSLENAAVNKVKHFNSGFFGTFHMLCSESFSDGVIVHSDSI